MRIKAQDYKKHSHDKCLFPLYFILTARNAILSGGYLLPHYISVFIYLVACEQALLGVGGREGERGIHPQESLLAGYLFGGIGDAGGYHCLKIVGLKFMHHTVKYGPSISWKQLLV